LIRVSREPSTIKIGGEEFRRKGHIVSSERGVHAYHYINGLPFDKWLRANDELKDQLNDETVRENKELYQLMNDQMVDKLGKNAHVTIGSHSHHHINLTALTSDELRFQLLESKSILNSDKRNVDAIAFPYGLYNDTTIKLARESGYRYLIAGGHVDPPRNNDVFPRIGVLDGAGFSYTMLMISNGFRRFGF